MYGDDLRMEEPLKAQWATIIHYEKDIFHFPLPHSFGVRAKVILHVRETKFNI